MTENTSHLNELINVVSNMLNNQTVDPDAVLSDLGIDSMNVVTLILGCEQLYPNFNVEKLIFNESTTLREIDHQLINIS